jgi:hypothetical protein
MKHDEQYCDNCGEQIEGENFYPVTLEVDIDSANAGESAIMCPECNDEIIEATWSVNGLGFDSFILDYKPKMEGDDVSGWTLKCYQYFEKKDMEELSLVPINNIWTLIEGDDGHRYIANGMHLVNREAYIVTEKPWSEDQLYIYA